MHSHRAMYGMSAGRFKCIFKESPIHLPDDVLCQTATGRPVTVIPSESITYWSYIRYSHFVCDEPAIDTLTNIHQSMKVYNLTTLFTTLISLTCTFIFTQSTILQSHMFSSKITKLERYLISIVVFVFMYACYILGQ